MLGLHMDNKEILPIAMNIKAKKSILCVKSGVWYVSFDIEPDVMVFVEGCKPSIEEFRDALRTTMLPMVAVDGLYVAASYAFDLKGG